MAEDNNFNLVDSTDIPEIEEVHPIIKVIGVGGGGNNAINHMYRQGVKNISFVVLNTDEQALRNSPVPNKLLIGPNTTHGLGAGAKPEIARQAAEESREEIAKLFDDGTRMAFITAGMGGGTGTGAAPVVAEIAKSKNVLTVGIVTIPFLFEGERKILKAIAGADEMTKYVDAILIINNERLTEIYNNDIFTDAFGKADDTLSTAARSISELITEDGYINLDFNDVNTTLRDGGVAIISSGLGEGDHRVTKAIKEALNSPLLKNRDVEGSKKILFAVHFSRKAEHQFRMDEANELNDFVASFAPDLEVIWGAYFDDSLEEKVRITLLASGFNVTLGDEKPAFGDRHKKADKKPITETTIDPKRIGEEYGDDKIDKRRQEMARARFIVLTPEQFDNEEIVNIFEKNPTFNRDVKVRESVRNASIAVNKTEIDTRPLTPPEDTQKTTTIEF